MRPLTPTILYHVLCANHSADVVTNNVDVQHLPQPCSNDPPQLAESAPALPRHRSPHERDALILDLPLSSSSQPIVEIPVDPASHEQQQQQQQASLSHPTLVSPLLVLSQSPAPGGLKNALPPQLPLPFSTIDCTRPSEAWVGCGGLDPRFYVRFQDVTLHEVSAARLSGLTPTPHGLTSLACFDTHTCTCPHSDWRTSLLLILRLL